jgi:hypothetical protein
MRPPEEFADTFKHLSRQKGCGVTRRQNAHAGIVHNHRRKEDNGNFRRLGQTPEESRFSQVPG